MYYWTTQSYTFNSDIISATVSFEVASTRADFNFAASLKSSLSTASSSWNCKTELNDVLQGVPVES